METTDTALLDEPSRSDSSLVPAGQDASDLTRNDEAALDSSGLTRAGSGAGIAVNGNHVKAAVANLPEDQREAILWLYQLGREKSWDEKTLAGKLRREKKGTYDRNTLYSVFRGRYNGKLDNVVSAIKAFRVIHDNRERIERPSFITTELSTRIWSIADRTRAYNRVTLMYGDGQTGKSKALEEYTKVFTTTTRYVRLPTAAPITDTVRLIGAACNAGAKNSVARMKDEICKFFDPQTLLIIDELQQVSQARTKRDSLVTIDFLREVFDRSGCGLLLCGTNEAMSELETGENSLWLRQLRRRAFPKITLPSVASDDDIMRFAAHFGLVHEMPDEAVEETRRIANDDGIGLLITYFQGAARMAAAEDVPTEWEHFIRTIAAFAGEGEVQRGGGR